MKDKKSFVIIKGNEKIIVSAPHSTSHMRNNLIRPSETRTGELARKLSKNKNIFGIYKYSAEPNDANWDKKCKYKEKIVEIVKKNDIRALIDLHGMAACRKQDICIGINGGKNIKNQYDILSKIVSIFNKYGFKNISIDDPFKAENEYCVSTYISKKCDIPTFQIEINRKYRSAKYEEFTKYCDLINSLEDIIDLLKNNYKK